MSKNITPSKNSFGIEARIMLAVWEITKDNLLGFASRDQIILKIQELDGKKKLSDAYVRREINNLQGLPYITFLEEGKPSSGKMENPQRTYRLHEDTVIIPETAWILLDLAKRGRDHQITLEHIKETIQAAEKSSLSPEDVWGRIKEAARVGYIKESIRSSYIVSNRLIKEREYLEELAHRKVRSIAQSPPTANAGKNK
jgi:hypothetical protein